MQLQIAQSSALAGSWRLVSMGEPASPAVPPKDTELTVDFAGDRISGSGGCNRFTGSYQTSGDQLSISTLASTRKACEAAVMNQEMKYLAALQGAQRYEVNDQGELQIFYQTAQESGVLRFTAQTVRGLW
jgi:heat shock protein HslJ